jgi:SAM-dependent methyltransferase
MCKYLNRHDLRILAHGFFHPGFCPVCERPTVFFRPFPYSRQMREYYRCVWCRSIPRYRLFNLVLQDRFPNWRKLAIHESSPGGAMSAKFARCCSGYTSSNYRPDLPSGGRDGVSRNENLQHLTFADNSFELFVTMDVFEHLPSPELAFREIARTLKPGGAHLFTVPCDFTSMTVVRASLGATGSITHHLPPVYHGNPIDAKGSLVFRDWGRDLCDVIRAASGMETEVVRRRDVFRGIEPDLNEVYISRKQGA